MAKFSSTIDQMLADETQDKVDSEQAYEQERLAEFDRNQAIATKLKEILAKITN